MSDDDLRTLLAYDGPSLALPGAPDALATLAYFDSDAAAHAIDRILSARGIPFHVERPAGHWSGTRARISVTVPQDRQQEMESLLNAAADAGILERAFGAEGLDHY